MHDKFRQTTSFSSKVVGVAVLPLIVNESNPEHDYDYVHVNEIQVEEHFPQLLVDIPRVLLLVSHNL